MLLHDPMKVVSSGLDAEVLGVLAGTHAPLSGPTIAGLLGDRSREGVRLVLNRLTEQGIVLAERAGGAFTYRLNIDHLAAPAILHLAHLRHLLIDKVRERLAHWDCAPQFAAFFGSAFQGEMRPDSDIDLLIVRPDDIDSDDARWTDQTHTLAHDGYRWTGNELSIFELSYTETLDEALAEGSTVQAIAREGICVHGDPAWLRRITMQGRTKPAKKRADAGTKRR